MDASDAERRRIARDLHDGVVQQLAGVSFSLAAISTEVTGRVAERVDIAASITRAGMMGLRDMITEIYPPNRDGAGLRSALDALLKPLADDGVEVSLELSGDYPLRPEVADAIYRAAQEALRNVAVHAQASTVSVELRIAPRKAVLTVRDDGCGYDPDQPPGDDRPHFGIRMLSDLAREANGQLKLASAPGEGTTFMFELPIR
jgi:signal transduction histidine kinase